MLEKDFINNLGFRVKYFRNKSGMTQCELAEKIGIDEKAVSQIETGKRNITLKTLNRLINALEVSPSKLFNFDD